MIELNQPTAAILARWVIRRRALRIRRRLVRIVWPDLARQLDALAAAADRIGVLR